MSWFVINAFKRKLKVPDADASLNDYTRDVIGNKTDAAQTTASTTKSIVAYLKGIISNIADVTTAIGNVDTSVSNTSGTTTGLIKQDGTSGTPNVVQVFTSYAPPNYFGNWVEIDASVAADAWISHVTTGHYDPAESTTVCFEIGKGAAGAETTFMRFSHATYANNGIPVVYSLPIPVKVVSGTRLAARVTSGSSTAHRGFYVGISMYTTLET